MFDECAPNNWLSIILSSTTSASRKATNVKAWRAFAKKIFVIRRQKSVVISSGVWEWRLFTCYGPSSGDFDTLLIFLFKRIRWFFFISTVNPIIQPIQFNVPAKSSRDESLMRSNLASKTPVMVAGFHISDCLHLFDRDRRLLFKYSHLIDSTFFPHSRIASNFDQIIFVIIRWPIHFQRFNQYKLTTYLGPPLPCPTLFFFL